jgi:hypothetical protein
VSKFGQRCFAVFVDQSAESIGTLVAVPPKGESYALRHGQSEHPVVLDRHGLTVYREGSGGGRTETVTQAEVNRFMR